VATGSCSKTRQPSRRSSHSSKHHRADRRAHERRSAAVIVGADRPARGPAGSPTRTATGSSWCSGRPAKCRRHHRGRLRLILGGVAVAVTLLCRLGLRGLDALNARRADALASRVTVLRGLAVTAGVPQIVLEQLASAAQFCPLPPGIDVVVQGAPAHAFYAVVDGRVAVHRDGKAVVHLGPGDSFGERGLLDQAPRNATVTTEMDTTLLRVEGEALLDALEAAPGLRPALDLSSTAPGVQVPPGETAVVDDPRWSEA
jgi:hypothetical protein